MTSKTKSPAPGEKRVTLTMPHDFGKRIRMKAVENDMTATRLVVAALESYLKGGK